MYYEKLENGNLLIKAITVGDQKVIDYIIAAIEAYEATLTKLKVNKDGSYSLLHGGS